MRHLGFIKIVVGVRDQDLNIYCKRWPNRKFKKLNQRYILHGYIGLRIYQSYGFVNILSSKTAKNIFNILKKLNKVL